MDLDDAKVSQLPSSLRNLKFLIYLNLNVVGVFVLHNLLMGMKELRYPSSLDKKTKLKLSHLVKLETLENFSTECGNLEDLCDMARLKTLVIALTSENYLETLSASIGGLRHLENLDVS